MASETASPGVGGECGWQHNDAKCLPMQGRTCCSINGYCGWNETYCFESNGCQDGCIDPSNFYGSPSIVALSTTSGTSTSTSISSSTSTARSTSRPISTPASTITSQIRASSQTSLPSPTSTSTNTGTGGLSGPAKTGAIAGGSVGGVALLVILVICFIFYRKPKASTPVSRSSSPEVVEPIRPPPVYQSGLQTGSNFGIRENE
ncbi:hypothetical protein BKA64DRAFT_19283 [Cadophora sp. MPI-SDFR-AT-0126]|nr:hypothetical protein BKA64DRAFT_19283 [Leotiomycetes sp. MPI-SDFR-AT-0126]